MSDLTSWIDRITQGFTLNYFLFQAFDTKVTTAFGDIFFMLGILLVIFEKIRRKKNSTHPFEIFDPTDIFVSLTYGSGVGCRLQCILFFMDQSRLREKTFNYFFIINFLFGWLGAKVFFLLFSKADQALTYSQEINFWLGGALFLWWVFLRNFSITYIHETQ